MDKSGDPMQRGTGGEEEDNGENSTTSIADATIAASPENAKQSLWMNLNLLD